MAVPEITNPKERFTTRVDVYRKFRPHYPADLLMVLRQRCGLTPESLLADIGAGTGLLTAVFLQHGNYVVAVEPNAAMRTACEELRAAYPKLKCVDGAAEATGLPGRSVNFVTVGQALHWFDRPRARREFQRILRPGGALVVVMNERRMGPEPFLLEYEHLLCEYGVDYPRVKASYLTINEVQEFFAPVKMHMEIFPNFQDFDFDGLLGRTLSSSYMPQPGHTRYGAMHAALERLFARHQSHGEVSMMYDCRVHYGQLT